MKNIDLPGIYHYRPTNQPEGTMWLNTADGNTYISQRGFWVCISSIDLAPTQAAPAKKSILRRIINRIKSLFS